MSVEDAEWRALVTERLKQALQAIALPSPQQIRLFPSYAVPADELALDFDHWIDVAGRLLEPTHLAILIEINTRLDEGRKNQSLWTLEALASSSEWCEIREMAGLALCAIGWPAEVPPMRHDEFARGG